jgi:serine/threonine protein kinase
VRLDGHANLVSVTDFAEANGTAYLVMSYIDGVSLRQHLANCGGRVPYQTAVDLLMPVMDALRWIHGHGVLHRGISPGNIMITRRGQVKVVDFGTARYAIGEQSKSLSMIPTHGFR